MTSRILVGDARAMLATLPSGAAAACITSPPYWRQRNYTTEASGLRDLEIGQEDTPEAWVATLTEVFRGVRHVIEPQGALWLNVGDKFAAGGYGGGGMAKGRANWRGTYDQIGFRKPPPGYKAKDLSLAPFKLAESLRADGWYLRQVVIWSKAVASEPPRLDRPSSSHEYLFLLTVGPNSWARDPGEPWWHSSVWNISTHGSDGSHVAQMPVELARRCIVTATRPGDTVLDPFLGSGTTLLEAERLGRHGIGIELEPGSALQAQYRIEQDAPLFTDVAAS
jgi:DNA modification methylase